MMSGALIETNARIILNQGISRGINQNQMETAHRMLKRGKMTHEEIAEDTGLDIAEVEQPASQIESTLSSRPDFNKTSAIKKSAALSECFL